MARDEDVNPAARKCVITYCTVCTRLVTLYEDDMMPLLLRLVEYSYHVN
jgi:hypothetical protein